MNIKDMEKNLWNIAESKALSDQSREAAKYAIDTLHVLVRLHNLPWIFNAKDLLFLKDSDIV